MAPILPQDGAHCQRPAKAVDTDLANPTSNELYQRLGYRPVSDRAVLAFESATP